VIYLCDLFPKVVNLFPKGQKEKNKHFFYMKIISYEKGKEKGRKKK